MNKEKIDLTEIMGRFGNEEAARDLIEKMRWPDGPICPHCNSHEAYRLTPAEDSDNHGRKGLLKCKACRKQFTVTVGTIFEDSHIPLHKWLMAVYLICSSKKGMSANQLHRMLGITYKSAWFMGHRIRVAMTKSPLAEKLSNIVEVDETYVGGKAKGKRGRGAGKKTKVYSLIQRDGEARSFKVDNVKSKTLKKLIKENVVDTAHVMTDEFKAYNGLEKQIAKHSTINHGKKEYVRGIVHTNFAESYFSLLKRGILGTFHHVSEEHMPRYLSEFDYRWNRRDKNDGERTIEAIQNSKGKRLMYRDSSSFVGLN
jgi:transposase-like protein/transcription elongation factor Elf1